MSAGMKNHYNSKKTKSLIGGTTSIVKTIHAISEGEIVGLVDGGKSLFIVNGNNATPLLDKDGKQNFNGISFSDRVGLDDQDPMPGFNSIVNEIQVGQFGTGVSPVIRTVTNTEVERLTLKCVVRSFPSNGKAGYGSAAAIRIFINDELYNSNVPDHTSDINPSTMYRWPENPDYYFSIEIDLSDKTFPINIRMDVISADKRDTFYNDKNILYFIDYTEHIDDNVSYSGTALLGIDINLEQYGSSSIPTIAPLIDGKIIDIPVNYNPESRTYDGIWNGEFKKGYSNNPAWVLYDLYTNKDYGLGKILLDYEITPNKYDLYDCAVYNDELVSDGNGGKEPRYQYNGPIIFGEDSYKVLSKILSTFRCTVYRSGNVLYFTQDRPGEVVKIVNKSNVIDGLFTYSSSPYSGLFSVVNVNYNNPNKNYIQDQLIVEDNDLILKIGYKSIDIVAYGCTSYSQAYRFGLWYLYTQNKHTQIVSYQASLDHADCRPGEIVAICDHSIAGVRLSGRILNFDGNLTFTLDGPITLESGRNYKIMVMSDLGVIFTRDIFRENSLIEDEVSVVSVTETIPSQISKYSIFLLKSEGYIEPRLFRIKDTSQTENPIIFKISAVEYDPTKYDYIDNNVINKDTPDSLYRNFKEEIVSGIKIKVSPEILNNSLVNLISLSWRPINQAIKYRVEYKSILNIYPDIKLLPESKIVNSPEITIRGNDGDYTFLITGIDSFNETSKTASFEYFVSSKKLPIGNVSNFKASRDGSIIIYHWDSLDNDALLDFYEIRIGTNWDTSHTITTTKDNQFLFSNPKAANYMIKACSIYGQYSNTASSIFVDKEENENIVMTVDEAANTWPGILNGLEIGDDNKLYMTDSTANYTSFTIDLGKVLNVRPSFYVDFETIENSTIDEFSFAYKTIKDIPDHLRIENNPDGISIKIQVSYSEDNISFSSFVDYKLGFFKSRYIKVKLLITKNYLTVFPVINNIIISIDSKKQSEYKTSFTISISGSTVYYTNTYNEVPNISYSIIGGDPGDNVQIIKEIDHCTISIYDINSVQKSGIIDLTISGY